MDRQTTRQIRFYLRLHYPVSVTAEGAGFCGSFPDLPGCQVVDEDLPRLYAELEARRREWITARILAGCPVPLPNEHLEPPRLEACLAPAMTPALAVSA
jgi:predicted RNase H-like HicB family nuclease